jgi:hypothetical protein
MVRLVPGYIDPPETGPGFRKDLQREVDPYSLDLYPRRGPPIKAPPMENPQESVPHDNWGIFPPEDNPAMDQKMRAQGVAMQDQLWMGNDIFAGQPEAPLPRPRPQQPQYYGPNINPFPGPPPPQRGMPIGPPRSAPSGVPQHNYAAPSPRRVLPPSLPMGPPGGFPRQLAPSSIPQAAAPTPDQSQEALMRLMQLINGGFGGPGGG